MRRSILFVGLLLIGCHKSRDSQVVGTWKTSTGVTAIMTSDGGMVKTIGRLTERGKWRVEGDTVTETLDTLNGTPVSTIKERMRRRFPNPPARVRSLIDDMDKPNVYVLSADGKTMSTDKAKDTNSGPGATFTKS